MKQRTNISVSLILFLLLIFTSCSKTKEAEETNINNHLETTNATIVSRMIDIESYVPIRATVDSEEDDDAIIYYPKRSDSNYFVLQEFLEYDKDPSKSTIDKIKDLHIPELEKARIILGEPIVIRSAARSASHEKKESAVVKANTSTLMD